MEIYKVTVYANGDRFWRQNGKRHRLDGPAFEYANGDKAWYQNDELHRLDGPAIEWVNGDKRWCIEDKEYTEEEFNKKIDEMNDIITIDGVKYKKVEV